MNEEPTAEALRAMVEATPMRRMVHRLCQRCQHRWKQPSPIGRCPQCRAETVLNLGEEVSSNPRV